MKTNQNESVVQDWLNKLPFTQQAVLLLALRGADGTAKWTGAKAITFFVRDAVIKPAYDSYNAEYPASNNFMRCDYDNFEKDAKWFFDTVDELPHHFVLHLIHAAEIIGFNHPNTVVSGHFYRFYHYAVESFHMNPETHGQLNKRLKK